MFPTFRYIRYFILLSKENSRFYSEKKLIKLRADAIPTLNLTLGASQVENVHFDKSLALIDTSESIYWIVRKVRVDFEGKLKRRKFKF